MLYQVFLTRRLSLFMKPLCVTIQITEFRGVCVSLFRKIVWLNFLLLVTQKRF